MLRFAKADMAIFSSFVLPMLILTIACAKHGSATTFETDVVIIGAGMAGITAGKKLSENQVPFVILEATDRIGGRVKDADFDGMHIEYGAHWLHDLDANPLWPFAQQIGLQGEIDDYDSIKMIRSGGVDVTKEYEQMAAKFRSVEKSLENSQPIYKTQCEPDLVACNKLTMCDAFRLAGWEDGDDRLMQSTSFFIFDWMSGMRCENVSYYSYVQADIEDPHDFMVTDRRGFAFLLREMARQYLSDDDSRLRFNEVVTLVDYEEGNVAKFGKPVVIHTRTNTYLSDYVIITASNGVIMNGDILFTPALPDWKVDALKLMPTVPYTKIFYNFHGQKSIDKNAYVLTVNDNGPRGLNTVWQHLGIRQQFLGSELVMMTNLEDVGLAHERMNSSELIAAALDTLSEVYPHIQQVDATKITETHHCWSCDPFSRGAFATTTFGMNDTGCANLEKNVAGLLFFAGDGASCERFSSIDGAYLSALSTAESLIELRSTTMANQAHTEL